MNGRNRCARAWLVIVIAAAVFALMLGGGDAALAQQQETVLYEEHFDKGVPDGWRLESGWRLRDGALYGEGRSRAILEGGSWQNYSLRFRANLLKGQLLVDYRNVETTSRYFVIFQGPASLNKQTGSSTYLSNVARAAAPMSTNAWHEVEIAERGGHVQLKVDGKLEFDYADPEPLTWGRVAFSVMEDSAAYVDDVVVQGPAPKAPDPHLRWVSTGGPPGGIGYDIRMRPDNPDVMMVTDAFGGVFRSTDGGQSWSPSNEGITSRAGETGEAIPVFSLTIDPNNNDIVWIGMQNLRGIFKSTDGGRSWVEKVNGIVEKTGIAFRGFTVDPRSSDIVYAAGEVSSWEWAGQERKGVEFDKVKGVVYKTTDGGDRWTAVWRGDNLARYVWLDPRDPQVVYVSTGIFDREAANSDFSAGVPGGVGIIKSTDGGASWTQVNDGLRNLYVGSLFMNPANPDVLLAGAANNAGCNVSSCGGDFEQGNNPFVRGSGAYLSTDGGASWEQTLRSQFVDSVEYALSQPDIAYAAGSGGVYRSEDAGRTWVQVTGKYTLGTDGFKSGIPIDL